MNAAVVEDLTERTIRIKVADGPVVDITESWHVKVRKIKVEQVVIHIYGGETHSIRVNGGMVRVDGTISDAQGGRKVWSRDRFTYEPVDAAPAWAQKLWREAPAGVTEWQISAEEKA